MSAAIAARSIRSRTRRALLGDRLERFRETRIGKNLSQLRRRALWQNVAAVAASAASGLLVLPLVCHQLATGKPSRESDRWRERGGEIDRAGSEADRSADDTGHVDAGSAAGHFGEAALRILGKVAACAERRSNRGRRPCSSSRHGRAPAGRHRCRSPADHGEHSRRGHCGIDPLPPDWRTSGPPPTTMLARAIMPRRPTAILLPRMFPDGRSPDTMFCCSRPSIGRN